MARDTFSIYQAGKNLEQAYHDAKKNDLIAQGNHIDNGSIVHTKKVSRYEETIIPRNASQCYRFILERKDLPLYTETCLALPVARDEDFSWRSLSLMLDLKSREPELDQKTVYQAISEHPLVEDREMITSLEITSLKQRNRLEKEQATLTEESFYLLVKDKMPLWDLTFNSLVEAEDEAMRRAESAQGVFQVYALRRSAKGTPLFRAQFLQSEHQVEARFRLATLKNREAEIIGWQFFGTTIPF